MQLARAEQLLHQEREATATATAELERVRAALQWTEAQLVSEREMCLDVQRRLDDALRRVLQLTQAGAD